MMDWIGEFFGEMDDYAAMIDATHRRADELYPRARIFSGILECIVLGLMVGPLLVVVYLALNGRCSI